MSNQEQVMTLIGAIVNPISGKTLAEEARVSEIRQESEKLTVVFERSGISPEEKRKIETQIVDKLAPEFGEDNIFVKSISKDSGDVLATEKKATVQEATIKTGHASPAPKRKVEGVGKVIAISSCKGGVGKSTVAVNLALALKNKGYEVGMIDADIYGPSMPILLGKRGAKPGATEDKKMIPIEAHGLKFISFGSFIEEDVPVIWRGPMLGGVLNQFLFDVDWAGTDYLIIDLPPGTGDIQLSMIQATEVDGVVVVSTPQTVALHDTKKGLKMFQQVNVPIIGLVENMSYFVPEDAPNKRYYIFGEGGVSKMTEALETDFLGEIPLLTAIREGSDEGQPFMASESQKGSPVWSAYSSVAEKVDGFFNKNGNKKKGLLSNLFK